MNCECVPVIVEALLHTRMQAFYYISVFLAANLCLLWCYLSRLDV